jgi:SAM-dependent methyltransferase
MTMEVMKEVGIDISGQRSKSVREFMGKLHFHQIIVVCEQAQRNCPSIYPDTGKRLFWPFNDPAQATGTTDEKLQEFRQVRDQIAKRIREWLTYTAIDSEATHSDHPAVSGQANAEDVREHVTEAYGHIARGEQEGCCGQKSSCCGGADTSEQLAQALGYSESELAALPEGANMGLSCGNPTAIAALKPGEVVLDLGSGGGFDVFIAARKVGAKGRAIGVDMTPDMVRKARANAVKFKEQSGLDNVDFRLGEIEHLPAADNSVDVVISNCVINLSPDKPRVWREIARVLKPGGRVAVSDLALLKPIPEAILKSVEALVGCVAGAVLVSETESMAAAAGLANIQCESDPKAVEAMNDLNDPLYEKIRAALPTGTRINDYVTSLYVTATKPPACCCC